MEPQFQSSFERHLLQEQRRAVLQALSDSVPQEATVGEIVDAARALGWSDPMGMLTLQDFADALLGGDAETAETDEVTAAPTMASAQDEPRAKSAAKSKAVAASPAPTIAVASKNASTSSAALEALKSKLDADEPMSLEEAAEALIPIVGNMKTATMQQLEELTGIGRRKLRFHIGQLVRHGHLERHGMGRGTHYTTCS
ncbi:MAG: hypothetical protein KUG77_13825 [Nannocystaceae bacterium]|nr:hypothetical protein [Nannocystaceae bacterium]